MPECEEIDGSIDKHLDNLKARYDCSNAPWHLDPVVKKSKHELHVLGGGRT